MPGWIAIILAAILVAVLSVQVAVGNIKLPFGNDTSAGYTDAEIAEIKDLLTYHETTFECEVNEYGLIETVIYAAPAYGPSSDSNPKRATSDAPGIPLVGNTVDEIVADGEKQRCIDPFISLGKVKAFGSQKVPGTDTRIFDLEGNEKLAIADIPWKEINNLARTFVFEEGDDFDKFIAANAVYKEFVNTFGSILHQASMLGIESLESSKNWMLKSGSAGIGDWMENPDQESLPAILYGFTIKGECIPGLLFGVNIQDQRPEIFDPQKFQQYCDVPPPADADCTVDCTTTEEPPCPPGYTGTVPGVCKDSPTNAPNASTTAPIGGGDGGPAGPLTDPVTVIDYVETPVTPPVPPVVTPVTPTTPTAPVDTGAQTSNGTVPTDGGVNCNPVVMSC